MNLGWTFCSKTSWACEELVMRSVCIEKTILQVNTYDMLITFGDIWFSYDSPMDIGVTSIRPSSLINRQITSCSLPECIHVMHHYISHQALFLYWIIAIITMTLLTLPRIHFKALFHVKESRDSHVFMNDRIIEVFFLRVPTITKIPPLI